MTTLPRISVASAEPVDTGVAPGPPNNFVLPGFIGYVQEQGHWCWAAACESINNYLPGAIQLIQCEVASRTLHQDCCSDPEAFDDDWYLESALQAVGHYESDIAGSWDSINVNGYAGFFGLVWEIGVNLRPVAVRYALPGGEYHLVVICGYDEPSSSLLVWDPAGHYLQTDLAQWPSNLGDWRNTYFVQ